MILAKIAWRSIWRSPRRSWVLISAVAVGVFAFVGVVAYIGGLSQQLMRSAIELQGGHLQVAGTGYFDNPVVRTQVTDASTVTGVLDQLEGVQYSTQRRVSGMISSAVQSLGVTLVGVDPIHEQLVSPIPSLIIEGQWLRDDSASGTIIMGAALASDLDVMVGERVVLMVNDLEGEMSAGAYRVGGLFTSTSADYDRRHVFLHEGQAQTLVGFAADAVSTIAINLDVDQDVNAVGSVLRAALSDRNVEILTWLERSPMLRMMEDTMNVTNIFLVVILFSAIGFTLLNSFTMVIFERIREIGIMVAGGIRPGQVRLLFILEAAFIAMVGIGVGAILATSLIAWWSRAGLDLRAFSEGLARFGANAVVYPHIVLEHMATGFVLILAMVFLSVLYPAIKASRFSITDAMSHA